MQQNLDQDDGRLGVYNKTGHRIFVIPAEVSGIFRRQRDITQAILILIFLVLPWVKINGQQALLLNIPERKFAVFGITFWAHDGPLIFFILAILMLSLAFVTSVWGRVWCGWACPQTVFIDGVYRRIEILVEGDYIKRRKMRDGPWTTEKIIKTLIKWILYLGVSSLIAHSFAAYFIGSEELVAYVFGNPKDHMTAFGIVTFITLLLLFDFGWFREQFCIVMCPYGRFQSVLMDNHSLAVIYDEKRGEPRKGFQTEDGKRGDCVSCQRCVQVCPTGIDIRKGVQMECIGCTACMDACDDIMYKVKKPTGLIKYNSIAERGSKPFRPRTLVYLVLIIAAAIGLTYKVSTRTEFYALVLRAKDAPYQLVKENDVDIVTNHFKLHIQNQTAFESEYSLIPGSDWESLGIKLTMPINLIKLEGGQISEVHFFVKFDPKLTEGLGQYLTKVSIKSNSGNQKPELKEIKLIGPVRKSK